MTVQTHTVSTDALATLGTIIDESAGRDAIHLAVEPAIAGEQLHPGQHIRMEKGVAVAQGETYGIVDPFLKGAVQPGQRFWFVIYPRQITSLRHVWEHPKFDQAPPMLRQPTREDLELADTARMRIFRENSRQWLKNFCETTSGAPDFDVLMASISQHEPGYDYLNVLGYNAHGDIPPELWDHVENVLGRRLGPNERPEYFSCSC